MCVNNQRVKQILISSYLEELTEVPESSSINIILLRSVGGWYESLPIK